MRGKEMQIHFARPEAYTIYGEPYFRKIRQTTYKNKAGSHSTTLCEIVRPPGDSSPADVLLASLRETLKAEDQVNCAQIPDPQNCEATNVCLSHCLWQFVTWQQMTNRKRTQKEGYQSHFGSHVRQI
jgi:hypothetical protein